MSRQSGVTRGLDGAVQRLVVNGNAVEDLMGRSRDARGVTKYVGPPCDGDGSPRCLNGGQCRPFMRSFVCKCRKGFMGRICERGEHVYVF